MMDGWMEAEFGKLGLESWVWKAESRKLNREAEVGKLGRAEGKRIWQTSARGIGLQQFNHLSFKKLNKNPIGRVQSGKN